VRDHGVEYGADGRSLVRITGIGANLSHAEPAPCSSTRSSTSSSCETKVLFFDITFASLVEADRAALSSIKLYVCLTDAAHLPNANLPNLVAYETSSRTR